MLSPEFDENGVEAQLQAEPLRNRTQRLFYVGIADQADDVVEDDGLLFPALSLPRPLAKAVADDDQWVALALLLVTGLVTGSSARATHWSSSATVRVW